jgi:hypothetical protein
VFYGAKRLILSDMWPQQLRLAPLGVRMFPDISGNSLCLDHLNPFIPIAWRVEDD